MRAVALALLLAPAVAEAQAWTRDAGSAYVNLSFTRIAGSRYYGGDFSKVDLGAEYSQLSLGVYGEVGLVDRWLMLTASGELLRRNALAEQGATIGLGDTRFGLWSGILTAPVRLSLGLLVGVPTGDPEPGGANLDPDAALIARSLPTGDGEFDLEPALVFGTGFGGGAWPLRHYLVVHLGYQLRTRGFSDAIAYRLELGTQLAAFDRLWLTARLAGLESFASNSTAQAGFVGLGDGVTYTSAGVELSLRLFAGFGISAGIDTAFRARNVIAALPMKLAISYEL